MEAPEPGIDYEELRQILEFTLRRPVTTQEAILSGKSLLSIYDLLLK